MENKNEIFEMIDGELVAVDLNKDGLVDKLVEELSFRDLLSFQACILSTSFHPTFSVTYPDVTAPIITRAVAIAKNDPSKRPVRIAPYKVDFDYAKILTSVISDADMDIFVEKSEMVTEEGKPIQIKQSDRIAVIASAMFNPHTAKPIPQSTDNVAKRYTSPNKVIGVLTPSKCNGVMELADQVRKTLVKEKKTSVESRFAERIKVAAVESAPPKLPVHKDKQFRFRPMRFQKIRFSPKVGVDDRIDFAQKCAQALRDKKSGIGFYSQSHIDGATTIIGPQRKLQDRVNDFCPPADATAIWTDTKDQALLHGMRHKLRRLKQYIPIYYPATHVNERKIKKEKDKGKDHIVIAGCPYSDLETVLSEEDKLHIVSFATPIVKVDKGVEGIEAVREGDRSKLRRYKKYHSYQFYVSVHGWAVDAPFRLSWSIRNGYLIRVSENIKHWKGAEFLDTAMNAVFHSLVYLWVRESLICVEDYRQYLEVDMNYNFLPDKGEEELIEPFEPTVIDALTAIEKEEDFEVALSSMKSYVDVKEMREKRQERKDEKAKDPSEKGVKRRMIIVDDEGEEQEEGDGDYDDFDFGDEEG